MGKKMEKFYVVLACRNITINFLEDIKQNLEAELSKTAEQHRDMFGHLEVHLCDTLTLS